MSDEEKAVCSAVVSGTDLDRVVLAETSVMRLWGAAATTIWNWVLIDPAEAADRDGWMRLIAHEAVHVEQWADRGLLGFGTWYLGPYFRARIAGMSHWEAYRSVPAEIEASERVDAAFFQSDR